MEFLLVAILLVLIAYFMGLTMVNIIDQRLSNIRVNIPRSALPAGGGADGGSALPGGGADGSSTEGFANLGPLGLDEGRREVQPFPEGYKPPHFAQIDRQTMAMGLWDGGVSQACFLDHEHDGRCGVGPMNMADPRKMGSVDQEFFRRDYRPTDMTLQDYVNWLYLFRQDWSRLPYEHVKNLTKMLGGEKLQVRVGVLPPPRECSPAMNAEDWYTCASQIATPRQEVAPYDAYWGS